MGGPSRARLALHSPLGSRQFFQGRLSHCHLASRSGLPRPRGAPGPPVTPGRRAACEPQKRVPKVFP